LCPERSRGRHKSARSPPRCWSAVGAGARWQAACNQSYMLPCGKALNVARTLGLVSRSGRCGWWSVTSATNDHHSNSSSFQRKPLRQSKDRSWTSMVSKGLGSPNGHPSLTSLRRSLGASLASCQPARLFRIEGGPFKPLPEAQSLSAVRLYHGQSS